MPQNAVRFGAKCSAFWCKTQGKMVQNEVLFATKRKAKGINIHLAAFANYPLFVPKQTSAKIDYLRLGGRLVKKIAAIMLKILLKSGQKKVG